MSIGSLFSRGVVLLAWAFFMFLFSLGDSPSYGAMIFVTIFAVLFLAGMQLSHYPKGGYDPKALIYCEILVVCLASIILGLLGLIVSHVLHGRLNTAGGLVILLAAFLSKLSVAYVEIKMCWLWYLTQHRWWHRPRKIPSQHKK